MEYITKYFSDFTDVQLQQFAALANLYKEWNEKINIISRKDIEHLYLKHVLHSLSIAAAFDFAEGASIIDIGTGGGFPGIPLSIYFPQVQFHLVDSIGKKLKVVEAIASALELKNITTQHIRAEEIKNLKFDFAVSRAVAPLKELWKWSKPLLRKNKVRVMSHELRAASHETGNKQYKNGDNKLQETHNQLNGLICLKGGDLAQEIFESGLRPNVIAVDEIFKEDEFQQKYLLYVKA